MIGLIGFGRFGRLTVAHLSGACKMVVSDSGGKGKVIRSAGAEPVSLAEACSQEIVLLCMPISAMPATLEKIAPLLTHPRSLVVDVCSVKTLPVKWMRTKLPPTVSLLATHPMFGPDSAQDSLRGHKIVLCPERIDRDRFQKIAARLASLGLVVIESTPEDHDRQIAVSLALTHFIGRSLSSFGAQDFLIDTEGYKRLLHILEVVENDTWQLFEDMHRFNPFAAETRREFINALQAIEAHLSSKEK
ncbi:MAG: Prephenate and/or arogenate dehydrogenase (unknown specificity) (EC 1.3.1.12)(EC 1.3.1.43) [Olavius algarvensis Delta 4 endosymbiont]|nr:MAG: Prephenate and/or arogenate dehydrogenase (unknown specificity) (EC 1.3.1.12)(EC 1.3.1.43) [Olavius algarvensis Delta 4 endosymbiont]